ncbi:MAG: DUF2079 domain-containing protein [Firmicutes bacterium]|nr:DUF2079 domain-containing protein [Bacillota bacterium]
MPWKVLLAAATGLLFVAATAVKLWQYRHWLLTAYDAGIYYQAMWLVSHGLPDAYNFFTSQPNLADAEQWILFPLGFLTRLAGPLFPLAAQAAASALLAAAVAVYAHDRGLGTVTSFLLLAVAAAYPSVLGTHILDWHPDPVGAAALAWAAVLERRRREAPWERRREAPWLAALLVALLTKNQAAVPVAAYGLGLLGKGLLARAAPERRLLLWHGLWALGLGALFLAGDEWAATALLGGRNLNVATDYASLGGSLPAVLLSILHHPLLVARRVAAHPDYWRAMLEPLAYLPLLAPLSALSGLAAMAADSLADQPALTLPYDQYALWAAPGLLLATVDALARLRAAGAGLRQGRPAVPGRALLRRLPPPAGLLSLAVLLLSARWLLGATLPNEAWRLRPPAAEADLRRATALIPPEAALYGENGTVSWLAWRRFSGSWPYTDFRRFVAALPEGVPLYVFAAPDLAFAGIDTAGERRLLARLEAAGARRLYDSGGVWLLEVPPGARARLAAAGAG